MRILTTSATLAAALLVASCSAGGGTTSTSTTATSVLSASPSPLPTASSSGSSAALVGVPWVLPTPTSAANAAVIWCSALSQVIGAAGTGTPTPSEAQKQLNALATYGELWQTGAQNGYVTQQEADVNLRFLAGYEEMIHLLLSGKKADSPEYIKVQDGVNAMVSAAQSLFDSSSAKVTSMCQTLFPATASPAPSAG